MAGYTRNDTPNNIADGNVINASDLDGEFDAIEDAFNGTTGHSHDGSSGAGPQIAAAGIASNAVTTAKILDANVTTDKIADNNVTTAKILNANVTTAKIAADAIDGTKIADDVIDSEHYVAGSIDAEHLAADIIDGTKIADDVIDSEHYVAGSIDAEHLASNSVTSAKLDTNIQVAGTLGVTGETTLTTHLNMGDNDIIKLGDSADLQIYHDASNSYIKEVGDGGLIVQASTSVSLQGTDTSSLATFFEGGAVTLYHDNLAKLATTSTGVDITGDLDISNDVEVTGRSVGGTPTPENDGSFDLSANNDFTCTTTADTEITFTNAAAGQSGNIKFVNGGNHLITADTMVAINADVLSTLSVSGTYHLAYYVTAASGNDTILVSASAALT